MVHSCNFFQNSL